MELSRHKRPGGGEKRPNDYLADGPLYFAESVENRRELTTAEKKEAVCKFSSLAEELLLRFADNVRLYDGTLISGQKEAQVCLYAPLGCDGERVRVKVGSLSRKDGTTGQYITLGDARYDKHRYYVDSRWGSSDEVLRYDRLSPTPTKGRNILSAHQEISQEKVLENLCDAYNELENQKLERELGINDQPVSPDEINELAALMEHAEHISSWYE